MNDIQTKQSQMKKGLLEFAILLIIANKEVYASEIIEELKKRNLIVVEGTLYPLLSRIKNSGLLSYSWVESESGPPRKYYTLTNQGKITIKELTKTWKQLSQTLTLLEEEYEKSK